MSEHLDTAIVLTLLLFGFQTGIVVIAGELLGTSPIEQTFSSFLPSGLDNPQDINASDTQIFDLGVSVSSIFTLEGLYNTIVAALTFIPKLIGLFLTIIWFFVSSPYYTITTLQALQLPSPYIWLISVPIIITYYLAIFFIFIEFLGGLRAARP